MKRKRNGLFYSKKEETINPSPWHRHCHGSNCKYTIPDKMLPSTESLGSIRCMALSVRYGRLLSSSTLYHSLKHHNPWKRRLRHWDHAAIYWHIAGSYSPITLIALREDGGWGWGLFGFVWLCAIIGTVVSFRKMEEHSYVETVCYILMGLSVLVVFKQLSPSPHSLLLDYCRGGMLHHGSRLLLLAQSTVHAFGFPFLCIGRFSLPHGGCMGHTGEDAVSKRQAHNR